jgi:ELWxxDGT repeat protein
VLDDGELCAPQRLDDDAWKVKTEIQGDGCAEEVVDVDHVVSDVERDQRQTSGRQSPASLPEDRAELGRTEVHDGIERHDAREARLRKVELSHVSDAELNLRLKVLRHPDHLRREVDADDGDAPLLEIPGDLPGSAPEVGHEAAAACFLGEAVEEVPVERLVVELRGEMLGVGLGRRVVAFADVHGLDYVKTAGERRRTCGMLRLSRPRGGTVSATDVRQSRLYREDLAPLPAAKEVVMRRTCIFGLAMAVSMAGVALPGQGQGPVLVRDIMPGPASSSGSFEGWLAELRGKAYLTVDDGFLGSELWVSNGTPRGTRLAVDLCPGRCSGNPARITPSGGLLYFFAGNTTDGNESFWLWRSDGTPGGTFPLVDLEIGVLGWALPVSFLAPFQDGVVFIVHNRVRRGWSLWRSDGTRAGTREIEPLPGEYNPVQNPFDSEWARLLDDSGHHYFSWRHHLWVTDGTAEGTRRVSTPVRPCENHRPARLGRWIVYAGQDDAGDCEPWVSDGTSRGTRQLREIARGASSYPSSFVAAGKFVYFIAVDGRNHQQLWRTDGTPDGTEVVRALGARGLGKAGIVGTAGSRVYFFADDGAHGIELWRTDGSAASTALVADLSPGAADTYFTGGGRSGDHFVFAARPSGENASALFRTQGTGASTARLSDSGLAVEWVMAAVGDRVYFLTAPLAARGQKIGVTDGTAAGTHVLDLGRSAPSSNPHRLIAGSAGLAFLVCPVLCAGERLWRSGGHAEDTEELASDVIPWWFSPGSGGAFFATFDEGRFGWTDGQTIRDLLPPGSLSFPQSFVDLGDRTLFFATRQISESVFGPWIWSSDGTPEGTSPVAPTAGDTGVGYYFLFRAALVPDLGEVRYLVEQDTPRTLSKLAATDGTEAGSRELVRIPMQRFEHLVHLVAIGRNVFVTFWNNDRAALWVSDGTHEGTREIYAIPNPWDHRTIIYDLVAAGDQAFFPGDDFEHGRELWVSDGTRGGTHRVMDLAPGPESSTPSDLYAFGDRLLFAADDGEHGRELWVSDGTVEGTRLLEIQPGPRGSYPQEFQVVGDQVVFAADDGVHGLELWATDGTPEGTHLVTDLMAGPRASSPRDFEVFGDELFFSAGRPQEGYELWKLPLDALER